MLVTRIFSFSTMFSKIFLTGGCLKSELCGKELIRIWWQTLWVGWLVVLGFKGTLTAKVISWRSVTHYVFPGFLTPLLTQLFFPKPPTTFLTCFCRVGWLVVLGFNATLTAKVISWRSVTHYVFPGFLTPLLTQLFFPKPPTTFLTCFCRG